MDTKTCAKCEIEKPVENFSLRRAAKDGRHSWCKLCFAAYEKDRYHSGDKARKEANKARTVKKAQDFLWEYLSANPCSSCGEADPLVLDFDHLDPSVKDYNVCEMAHLSTRKIQEEIDKCRVLCANCHRRHTAVQFGFWKSAR